MDTIYDDYVGNTWWAGKAYRRSFSKSPQLFWMVSWLDRLLEKVKSIEKEETGTALT